MTHGAVLHLTNIRTCIHGNRNNYSDDIDETELGYKHIKEYFSDFGRVAHVDYNPGDTQVLFLANVLKTEVRELQFNV